jgi:hypothetical protein
MASPGVGRITITLDDRLVIRSADDVCRVAISKIFSTGLRPVPPLFLAAASGSSVKSVKGNRE